MDSAKTIDMETLILGHGSHTTREDGVCAMEAVAWLAGEPHSDHPACTCPVIASFVRTLNDRFDNEQRQELKAFLPRLIGTRANLDVEVKRSLLLSDFAVRRFAADTLDFANLGEEAAKLRLLAEVKDEATARAAARAADMAGAWAAARAAAWAADWAADRAARAADRAADRAARATARAARAAARATARAAWAGARATARAAAWAGAWAGARAADSGKKYEGWKDAIEAMLTLTA